MVFAIIIEVFSTIVSINKNIRSIISEWEKTYLDDKAAAEAAAKKVTKP
jgi:NAD+--asparagine ADP-ribosyltransferase